MSERASNETTPIVPMFGAPDVRQVGTIPVTQWVANAVAFILTRLVRETDLDQSGLLYEEAPKSKEIPPRPAIFQEAVEELRDEEMRREFEASKARAIAHMREHYAAGNGINPEFWIKQLEEMKTVEDIATSVFGVMRCCDALIDRLWKSPGEDLKEFERVMAERGGMESPTMDEVAATPLTGCATMHDKPGKSGAECVIREHCKPDRNGIVMPPNVTMALIAYGEGSITLRQLHQRIRAIEEDIDVWGEDSVDTAPKAKPEDAGQFCQHGHGWAYECSACGRMSMDQVPTPMGGHPEQYANRRDYTFARDMAVDRMRKAAQCAHGYAMTEDCDRCGRGFDPWQDCPHVIPYCHACKLCGRDRASGEDKHQDKP